MQNACRRELLLHILFFFNHTPPPPLSRFSGFTVAFCAAVCQHMAFASLQLPLDHFIYSLLWILVFKHSRYTFLHGVRKAVPGTNSFFAVFFAVIYPLLTIFLTCYTLFLCVSCFFSPSTCTCPDPSLILLLYPPSNIRFTSALALWRSFNPSSSGSAAIKAAPVTPLPAIDLCCRGHGAAFARRSRPFRTVCAQQRGHGKPESSKGRSRDASIPACYKGALHRLAASFE